MPDYQFENLEQFGTRTGIIAPRGKPRVIVPGGSVSITDSAKALYQQIAPSRQLFIRDGNVTQLIERNGHIVLDLLRAKAVCVCGKGVESFGLWRTHILWICGSGCGALTRRAAGASLRWRGTLP
jgi:hypothetical protein